MKTTNSPAAILSEVMKDVQPLAVKVAVQRANGTRATLGVTLGEYPGTR